MQGTPELETLCTRIYIGSTTSTTAACVAPHKCMDLLPPPLEFPNRHLVVFTQLQSAAGVSIIHNYVLLISNYEFIICSRPLDTPRAISGLRR